MLLKSIYLQNFRNFESKNLTLSGGATVIVGPNGAGKTNILESIYLLSTGKSFRADLDREMIRVGVDFARVKGEVESNVNEVSNISNVSDPELEQAQFGAGSVMPGTERLGLEVVIAGENGDSLVATSKRFLVNNVSRRLYDFAGNLKAVAFGPWDLELVTGSPAARRRFLDFVLSQVDREYRRSLLSYEKGLRQRNRILEKIREGEATRSQLLFWDRLVVKNGNYITAEREGFVEFVNKTGSIGDELFAIDYDKSTISEERLAQYAKEEVVAAATLVGPHRDDIIFKIRNPAEGEARQVRPKSDLPAGKAGIQTLATYGSRGEQRMGVLWLKLAELSFVEAKTETHPVLLLDDIFSELDRQHHEVVMGAIGNRQTIITTADGHLAQEWKDRATLVAL